MAKSKIEFVCTECGNIEPKWTGKCPECGEWNCYVEQVKESKSAGAKLGLSSMGANVGTAGNCAGVVALNSIATNTEIRLDSGIEEVNRVLGGGLIAGAAILVGGEPGIGKSTLMMQLAQTWKGKGSVLYVSGEESGRQLKLRADRLQVTSEKIDLLCETSIERIVPSLNSGNVGMVIVDSIQTMISSEAGAIPGTVNQIKYCGYELVSRCKEKEIPLFLIAHVTKEGQIAGPKVLEHMVDTVLYFDAGDGDIRILRTVKNRFGASDETGFFLMKGRGLESIGDPAALFVSNREGEIPDGVASASVYEGSRSFPVEVQALVVESKSSISRTFSDRVESQRVSRLAAVLEKMTKLRFSDRDLYINVAGGFRLIDHGADLPLAAALYSARTGLPVVKGTILAGEVSLAGEIRAISHLDRRVKAASLAGYKRMILPTGDYTLPKTEMQIIQCATISEAMRCAVQVNAEKKA